MPDIIPSSPMNETPTPPSPMTPFFDGAKTALSHLSSFLWELVKVTVLSVAIILPIRYFLIQPFYVRGASMEPNFYDREYLIIDEISYGLHVPFTEITVPFSDPIRGDIVVFRYPRDPRQFFIKRVIGLPGETVIIRDGGVRIVNRTIPDGIALTEPYLSSETKTWGEQTTTLGQDEYLVLGDNRTSSLDSRAFGAIHRSDIVGKTWIRGWPFDRFMKFTPPSYNL